MNEPDRPNFVSIYREEVKRTRIKVKNRTITPGRERSKIEPPKKIQTGSDPQKEEELLLEPKKEETPEPEPKIKKEKIYKVLYRDLNTGDWFFELNTKDRVGHHIGLVADIVDTV